MSVEYRSDFSEVAKIVGTVNGAAKVVEDDQYMDMLLTQAHGHASRQFDTDATAFAMATGAIPHMFEWGTTGINSGRTTRRFNPNSAESKLWRHTLRGFGGSKSASFVFEPSVVPVPKPTVARTDVPVSELKKLTGGPYVFAAKAAVMEAGITVTIRPKNSLLFVPFGNEDAKDLDAQRHGRNFVFTKGPVYAVPGKTVAGNFTKFWIGWWSEAGQDMVTEYIQGHVNDRMATLVDSIGRKMGRRPQKMTAAGWSLDVERAEREAKAFMFGGLRDGTST